MKFLKYFFKIFVENFQKKFLNIRIKIPQSLFLIPCSLLLAPCSLLLNILLLSKTPQLELDSRAAPACCIINLNNFHSWHLIDLRHNFWVSPNQTKYFAILYNIRFLMLFWITFVPEYFLFEAKFLVNWVVFKKEITFWTKWRCSTAHSIKSNTPS